MDAILAIFTYAEKNNIGSIVQDKLTTWFIGNLKHWFIGINSSMRIGSLIAWDQ